MNDMKPIIQIIKLGDNLYNLTAQYETTYKI